MRDIKFRAWDSTAKEMFEWDELVKMKAFPLIFTQPENYGITARLQYTGLKDKNGVEIYEGDIVHDTMSGSGPCEVKVDVGNFYIDWGEWPDWSWNEMAYDHMNRVEVIGNIYENTELLR